VLGLLGLPGLRPDWDGDLDTRIWLSNAQWLVSKRYHEV